MTEGDQPEQLQSVAGQQQDSKLPELTTCAKCGARLSGILNSCPSCEKEIRKGEVCREDVASNIVLADSSLLSVRYLILQVLAERNEPTYAKTIAQRLAQYGVKMERILIELNRLTNGGWGLVKRVKASYPFKKRFLYSITEKGVVQLQKRKSTLSSKHTEITADSLPIDPYLWLLENLIEPMTVDDLTELRGDSKVTLRIYLSHLYKLGVINKYRQPEERETFQRNRRGDITERKTTVFRTYYQMKGGPLKEKIAQDAEFATIVKPAQTFKIEVPIEASGVKEPVFSAEEDERYQKWREDTRDMEEFHAQILKRANKAGIRPAIAYRLVFKQLRDNGKL